MTNNFFVKCGKCGAYFGKNDLTNHKNYHGGVMGAWRKSPSKPDVEWRLQSEEPFLTQKIKMNGDNVDSRFSYWLAYNMVRRKLR